MLENEKLAALSLRQSIRGRFDGGVRWEQNHCNIQISHPPHSALRLIITNKAKQSAYNPDLARTSLVELGNIERP